MIGNKGNSNSNAYFTRSGSFSTHGSRKGTHYLYDFELTEDQMATAEQKREALCLKKSTLSARQAHIKTTLNIGKNSAIKNIYNGFLKTAPKNSIFMNNRELHRLLLEGVNNQNEIADIEVELKNLQKFRTINNVENLSFERCFVDVCREVLTDKEFKNIKNIVFNRIGLGDKNDKTT